MNVPLLDLKAQYTTIRDEMTPALQAVMDSQYFINGPQVKELEKLLAEYCDCADAVGVSSGTDALLASLMTLGVSAGDEVITTPYTFFSTGGCIWRTGAKPVFVDIEPDTFNIDPSKIEAAITEKTKVIMPVHLFGQVAEMAPIVDIAAKRDLYVIEDAAQAIGATYKGQKAGSFGTTGCFSFFPSKNLGGLGDGGMVVTKDADLAERLRQCRNHGSKPKYYHKWVGGNFRLDTLQAAGLIVKLRHLDDWSAKRRANAARYGELFADFEPVKTPVIRNYNLSIFNQYVLRVPKRDELREFLKENNIGCEVYYPLSLHEQECFGDLGYKRGDFPESESAADETIALPIYAELTDEQICYVAGTVKEFLS
ncbi:MAG: DegT/DnrJ/EryC1/StrS family aminotransferase [Phycisphaerae bacterium]|nr:DegT/DnrJ/EryC1/StrS family aminotransferase [Phycisphaerae bacterium]